MQVRKLRRWIGIISVLTGSLVMGSPIFCASPQPDTSGAVQLLGRFSSGHACPIAPQRALTASHVIDIKPFDLVGLMTFRWQQGETIGRTIGASIVDNADLGEIRPNKDFPKFYPIATTAPIDREHLWIQGFDFRKGKSAFASRVWEVEVLRTTAGHVVFSPTVDHGTSGSCVLNAKGEVVGIVSWGVTLGNNDEVGVAVGVWGELLPKSGLR